jgi:DNA polymerase-3 subunit gamma/tau
MAPDTVQEHLAHVLQTEGVPYEDAALAVLGRAARGSMRDALSLTDQALAYGQGRLEAAAVRTMIGVVDEGHAVAWLQALAAHDAAGVMQALAALRDSGQSAAAALDAMAQALQSIAMEQVLPGSLVNAEDQPWRALAAQWDRQEVQLLYSMLLAARPELGLAPDEHAALLMVAWRYLSFVAPNMPSPAARPQPQPLVDTARRPARVDVRPVAVSRVDAVPPSVPVTDPGSPPWDVADEAGAAEAADAADASLMDRWCTWVQAMVEAQGINALVRELALQAECVAIHDPGHQVHLHVNSESLAGEALAAKLAEALRVHTGQPWALKVTRGDVRDSLALRDTRRRERRQAQAEAMILQDPLVQDLLSRFPGARLVPGSVRPLEPSA